ncbi:MAG: IS1096 element passenger TnpR family protein [Bacteroidota bacterium]
MAVYKFKLTFEEYDDIYRMIEIKSSQTFFEFHKAILDSIGFDQKQLASFYMSNDSWKKEQEICLEDMSDPDDEESIPMPTMKESRLSMFINDPHQKIIYVYDFMEMWTMHLELVGIEIKEKAGTKYPVCSKSFGLAPKQYDKVQRFGLVDENEFDEITKNYLDKSDEIPGEISDDEAEEFGLFGDGEEGGESGYFDDEKY